MSKPPKPLSQGEEAMALHLRAHGIAFDREVQFAAPRKWKFDFVLSGHKVAVEIEGGTQFGKSRHSSGSGFEGDCIKYNHAARNGWIVLRYSTRMVLHGEAIMDIVEMLQ